ncbi:MAG: DUF1820 family protein [Mariprofundaceae bacterium]|nr:DUF1820 family protein [Mariprofundaceae bacterium]
MSLKNIYKIQFINQDKVYEVFAQSVGPSGIPGFVELGELIFGEKSSLVLDPAEEGLKNEFAGVKRSYIPLHCVIRIDEVTTRGQARITPHDQTANVHNFPTSAFTSPKPPMPEKE